MLPGRQQAIILTIILTIRNKFQWNFNHNSYIFFQENPFKNVCEMLSILSRPQYVKLYAMKECSYVHHDFV